MLLANFKIIIFSLIQDELFPYVRKNLYSHFENRWDSEELQNDIESLRAQVEYFNPIF